MKKLLLMASLLVLSVSCADIVDAEIPTNNSTNNSKITPPAWIQGTWVDKETYDLTGYKMGYIFRTDDVCMLNVSHETCWKESIDLHNNTPNAPKATVNQNISDTEYKCSITLASQTIHYNFQKVSSNTIKNIDNGTIYTKI